MKKNTNLHLAKKAKNDEFYTQYHDIAKELLNYKEHFKNKIIYCNCDDPLESNFFKFFADRFHHFQLKKLICSCYKSLDYHFFSQLRDEKAVYLEYHGEYTKDNDTDLSKLDIKYFKGDGDFRNAETIELLKQADIIATNPPFSLFRAYIKQLIEYKKKFIVIGNMNALKYQEIFPLN